MIADFVGRVALPSMTLSDEVFGRLYYGVSSCVDTAQTVAKMARTILGYSLSLVLCRQSTLLNKVSRISLDDVVFSCQMTIYSILGVLSPRLAWEKKLDAHMDNLMFSRTISLCDVLLEQWGPLQSTGLKIFLAAQMLESSFRYLTSSIRCGISRGFVVLSGDNAPFVKCLSEGAYFSAESAQQEIQSVFQFVFDT